MASTPPLYRLSRLFGRLGVLALVAILAYVGAAAYSASQVKLGGIHSNNDSASVSGAVVTVQGGVYVQNNGFLAISNLGLVSFISLPSGQLLGKATSPIITVGGGQNATVPVGLTINLTATPAAESLLVQDAKLPTVTYANVTFAGITSLAVKNVDNYSWGAPFESLNVTPTAGTVNSNGTTTFLVRVSYQNAAPFGEAGTFGFSLAPSGGSECAAGTLPVDTPAGSGFDQTVSIAVPDSCQLPGGTVTATFTGSGFSVSLPSETIQ